MNLDAALRDLGHADARVRAQAADALGRVTRVEWQVAVPALIRATADQHPSVRYAALLSLGELVPDAHVDGVEQELAAAIPVAIQHLSDSEPLIREAAAIALGALGLVDRSTLAWEALAAALGSDRPELRFQAVTSLAELDAPRAAPLLRPLLADPDNEVRAQTVAALGDAADEASREAIAGCLDDGDVIRWEAALALARLRDRRGLRCLIAALGQRERALDAATALAGLGLGNEPELRAALEHELRRWLGDPLVKVRAAQTLARAKDPAAIAHLRRAARSGRDDVRGLALSVLDELGIAAAPILTE